MQRSSAKKNIIIKAFYRKEQTALEKNIIITSYINSAKAKFYDNGAACNHARKRNFNLGMDNLSE